MKKILLSLIFLPFSVVYGQEIIDRYAISGSVTDSLGNPVATAVVQLNTAEGKNILAHLCDNAGKFHFSGVTAGQYQLKVVHISYVEYARSLDVNTDVSLEPIILSDKVYAIETVDVVVSNIKYGFDNYTVSLQNNPLTNGKNALDILGYLPHVKNMNDEISILGQEVGTIRINGVVVTDLEELRAIPAENLRDVEIVLIGRHSTNAGGGEINIQLKKTPEGGFYGSLTGESSALFGYGHDNSAISSSFSYGIKKFSVYNYFRAGIGKDYSDNDYETRYKGDNTIKMASASTRTPKSTVSDRLSVNYDINSKHAVGTNISYTHTVLDPKYSSRSVLMNNNTGISSLSGAMNDARILNDQYQTSLIYNWRLDDAGSSFKLTGDYLHYATDTRRNYEYLYNIGEQGAYSGYSRNVIGNKVDMMYVNADFVVAVAQRHRLRFGFNYNNNRTRQILDYQNMQNDVWINNEAQSDNHKLISDDFSAFFAFSSKIGNRVTYDLSVRYRDLNMGYNSLKEDLENWKHFNNAEITASLMCHINRGRGDMFYFAYERWYDRIPYSAISPVVTYIDEYSYTKGNLGLEPTVMDNLFLVLTLKNNTEFNIRLQRVDNNGINYETFIDKTDPLVTYTMPVNGPPSFNASLSIDHTFEIARWWKLNVYSYAQWRRFEVRYPDIYKNYSWIGLLNIENTFEPFKTVGCMISFNGRTRSRLDERKFGSAVTVRFSAYKYFLDRKLQLSIGGTIFNHTKWTVTETDVLWMKHTPRTKLSSMHLRLSYNFTGGKKVKVKRIDGVQSYDEIKDELLTQ